MQVAIIKTQPKFIVGAHVKAPETMAGTNPYKVIFHMGRANAQYTNTLTLQVNRTCVINRRSILDEYIVIRHLSEGKWTVTK